MKDPTIVIVDGYSFVFRAYHAMPPLTRPEDGLAVGAVYGFTSMLMKLLSTMKPSHLVVVFDAGKKTYRNEIYPEYKANRPPPPEDLIPQFPLVREAAKAFNIKILEQVGFEADDVIATLVRMAKANKEKILIVSSDKDLMQLVNPEVKMYDALRMKLIGEKEVKEKFGVFPNKMRDLLALMGDSSDNIPGLPGIGPKTASELLNKYDNIPEIIKHSGEIKQPKRREAIENGTSILDLSVKLVSLRDDLHIDIELKDLKAQEINSAKLLEFLNRQGFKSLVARVKKEFNVKEIDLSNLSEEDAATQDYSSKSENIPANCKFKSVLSIEDLKELYSEATETGKIAIYLQNNFANSLEIKAPADVCTVGIACRNDLVHVLKFTDEISFKDFGDFFEQLLGEASITKILYDYKLFLHLIESAEKQDYDDGVEDVLLMAYSLGGGKNISSLERLLEIYSGQPDKVFSDVGGITKCRSRFSDLTEEESANYISAKTQSLFDIYPKLMDSLFKNNKQTLYQKFDRPLSVIVYNMEA